MYLHTPTLEIEDLYLFFGLNLYFLKVFKSRCANKSNFSTILILVIIFEQLKLTY